MTAYTRLLPSHRRVVIEAEIETLLHRATLLIGRLDRADEPLMDMEEDDHAGGAIEDDPHGEGVGHFGRGLLPTLPRYGVDQSEGPTNQREAERTWHKRMMVG